MTALPFISGKAEKDAEGPYPRGAHSLRSTKAQEACAWEKGPLQASPPSKTLILNGISNHSNGTVVRQSESQDLRLPQ